MSKKTTSQSPLKYTGISKSSWEKLKNFRKRLTDKSKRNKDPDMKIIPVKSTKKSKFNRLSELFKGGKSYNKRKTRKNRK
jgi:hypothetical protein